MKGLVLFTLINLIILEMIKNKHLKNKHKKTDVINLSKFDEEVRELYILMIRFDILKCIKKDKLKLAEEYLNKYFPSNSSDIKTQEDYDSFLEFNLIDKDYLKKYVVQVKEKMVVYFQKKCEENSKIKLMNIKDDGLINNLKNMGNTITNYYENACMIGGVVGDIFNLCHKSYKDNGIIKSTVDAFKYNHPYSK